MNFYNKSSSLENDSNISTERECIIIGDLNTNVQVKCNFCYLFSFTRFIEKPTRVTDHSNTLMDLTMVSQPEKICDSGVIDSDISDNNIIYCTRKVSVAKLVTTVLLKFVV